MACVNGIIRVHRYAAKAGTIVERAGAVKHYACANSYAGKAGATFERIVADRRYAVGDGYTGKAGAIAERIVADSGKLVFCRKGYATSNVAIIKPADFPYGQVWAACVGAVIGGYKYRSGCRTSADAICGITVDKRKAESRCSGGVFAVKAGVLGVRTVMLARLHFYTVRCCGGADYGGSGVPVVRVGVYGCDACGGMRSVIGAGSGVCARCGAGGGG